MSIDRQSVSFFSVVSISRHERGKISIQSGVSLIELIMFILIISIGIVGILSVMNVTSQHSADPMVRKQAIAIAESLLEEILVKDFTDPDGVTATEASRDLYDDVDDYSGFSVSPVKDINGAVLQNGAGSNLNFTATATVTPQAFDVVASANSKLITVTVSGSGETVSLSAYKVNN